jgi:septum formation protein
MKKLILASSSPRRFELLKQIGLDFEVYPADINETIVPGLLATEFVQNLSLEKASYTAKKLKGDFIVIGADTVVMKNVILGKPDDEQQAFEMLKSLSGNWHEVLTGITVYDVGSSKYISNYEITRVKMKNFSKETINSYIKTGEPFDKAGAYGIQGIGALLVEKIEGCYFNVVGLPLSKLSSMLEEFGLKIL